MATFNIQTIPHDAQRYNTIGDYLTTDGTTNIKVSAMNDEKLEFLVAVHELIESFLCREAGVTDEEIDAFDLAFEENRALGDDAEPGDDPQAPYHRQHQLATEIEKRLADELSVDWEEYSRLVAELMDKRAERERA